MNNLRNLRRKPENICECQRMDANGSEWMRMDANDSEWVGMAENVRIAFSPLNKHIYEYMVGRCHNDF